MKRMTTIAAVVGLAGLLAGCESQQRFASPEEAASALATAAEKQDKAEMRRIFGPRVAELKSGDAEQDREDLASFRRALAAGRQIERAGENSAVLVVGEEHWPFAVPLVKEKDAWRFQTDAGIEELENRRIGRNELRTIEACRTLIDAQQEYHARDRDGDGRLAYADRLMSTPGKKDGLYWESPGGVDPSPIGPVLAAAATRRDAGGKRVPFNGYCYRLLTRQGPGAPGGASDYVKDGRLESGWAVIAWPAEYDHTGVMTFITSFHGVVYEADLGQETPVKVEQIEAFDPSNGWKQSSP